MDYSQFQVNYIKNPTLESGKLPTVEFTDVPDYSNISYLNGEAAPATALIEEEEVKVNPIKKKTPKVKFTGSGFNNFNLYYDQAIKSSSSELAAQLNSRRNLFTKLANQESGFRHNVRNSAGVPAFGYFQFMQGNYNGKNYNNIGQYAGVDLDTFRNSPVIQIQAANNLANYFMSSFSKTELQRLHQMGYSDSAIIAGAWLGGPGGVRAFAFSNNNRKDVHGTSVGKYMQMFNNL